MAESEHWTMIAKLKARRARGVAPFRQRSSVFLQLSLVARSQIRGRDRRPGMPLNRAVWAVGVSCERFRLVNTLGHHVAFCECK